MKDLSVERVQFKSDPNFTIPIILSDDLVMHDDEQFDQSGYELMPLEQQFAIANHYKLECGAIRKNWFTQYYKEEGAVLNHAYILERKGFTGEAAAQLKRWASLYPCYYRYLNLRPKWGLDVSIDFFDHTGRTFESLHWEFDSFDYNEIVDQKSYIEEIIPNIDFDQFSEYVWDHRDEWYNLDYNGQTEWRCNLLGIIPDRWKMVVW